MTSVAEPYYVCYRKLHFDQPNFERFGWDLGIITPFISAGAFFADVATFPYLLASSPCRRFECSTGQFLPGDPVPLLLYPPEVSLSGSALEAVAIGAIFAFFPG